MVYVMSDLHGMYESYIAMLEKINFSDEDSLYILGDVCDRGLNPVSIYFDIMKRKNVFMIMGNHEKMLLDALPVTYSFLLRNTDADFLLDEYNDIVWGKNGSITTKANLSSCGVNEIRQIYNFVRDLPYYRTVNVGGRKFILIHTGIANYSKDKQMSEYSSEALLWYRPNFDSSYYADGNTTVVMGHTPTVVFRTDQNAEIYHGAGNIINIDCGAVYSEYNGKLACLRLDDMAEFYV